MRQQALLKMSEKQFQKAVIDLAKWTGWLAYHTYDSRRSEPGFPDLVLVHPTRGVLFRELKTMKGRVSAHQRKWLDKLALAGADVAVWRPNQLVTNEIRDELTKTGQTPTGKK